MELTMLDLCAPEAGVEILIREDGEVLWVNMDGVCRLRICLIQEGQLVIRDLRPTQGREPFHPDEIAIPWGEARPHHVQAAFINAIREEGTKNEACDALQKQWNEVCALRAKLALALRQQRAKDKEK